MAEKKKRSEQTLHDSVLFVFKCAVGVARVEQRRRLAEKNVKRERRREVKSA